jgi:hypothetical protein
LKLIESHRNVSVNWIVLSASEPRAFEARTSAMKFLGGAAEKTIDVETFRDGFFPYVGYDIKQYFEALKQRCSPDLIFTHYRDDRHQDHRIVSDLTWNTFRNHLILSMRFRLRWGSWLTERLFISTKTTVGARFAASSTRSNTAQSPLVHRRHVPVVARLRGIESAAPAAREGFHCRKAVFDMTLGINRWNTGTRMDTVTVLAEASALAVAYYLVTTDALCLTDSHYGGHVYSEGEDGFVCGDGPHVSYESEYIRTSSRARGR